MPIHAVIFDFNGVLVDDEHVHFELFRETLAAEGIVLDEATYHDRYLGFDDRGCFWNALRDNGRDPSDTLIDTLIAHKAVRYAEVAETGLRFFPHAAEALTFLATERPVAICSGALQAEIEYALKRLKLRHLVHSITSAEDTDRCKPDPQGYLLALDRLRADHPDLLASECLVIEDSIAGLQAASAAEMIAVGVTHTYSHGELSKARPATTIDGLGRITPEWLDGLSMYQEWFTAARQGNRGVVLELLRKGIDVNLRDRFGRTALWDALLCCRTDQIEMISCLLEHGADPNAKDCTGVTPTTHAAVMTQSNPGQTPDFRPLEMLKVAGAQPRLLEAVLMGDVDLARRLCDSDPSIDVSGDAHYSFHDTYLMEAAKYGFLDMVKFLLDRGANIEGTDDLGATALMRAAGAGHTKIVTLLLDRGADINHDDWSDQTPLSEATVRGHLEIVKLLVEHGADLKAVGSDGLTAFDWAMKKGHESIAECLKQAERP